MTLCKFRPQRTYCAQWIIERDDVNGLLKKLNEEAHYLLLNGEQKGFYYTGALLAFKTLFGYSEFSGEVDTWKDFMPLFETAVNELEGGEL